MKELKDMDRSVECLALALPESVYDDVIKKYNALKKAICTDLRCPNREQQ